MDPLVIIFEDLIRLIRKRSYSNFDLKDINVMIPALRDTNAKIIFNDREPYYYDSNKDEELVINGDCRTKYHITHHIIRKKEICDDITLDEIKHCLHCAEYCIDRDISSSKYIRVYMEM